MANLIRKATVLFLILCMISGIVGCSQKADPALGNKKESSAADQPSAVKTITDTMGNKIEVPAQVAKIGITPIPWASVAYAIDGSAERIAAINPSAMKAYNGSFFAKLAPEFANIDTSCIGTDFVINMEEMVNMGVDAMVIWDSQTAEAEQLLDLGIAPIMLQNETMEELQDSFRVMGELLGKEDRAEQFIKAYSEAYAYMKSKGNQICVADKPKVLYLRNSKLKLQGNDNFMKEALELAGADNIAAEDSSSITMEEILLQDPDIILMSNFDSFVPADIYDNKIEGQDWSGVSAVVNKRVYKTPIGIYRWDAPGVETPLMMLWMAKKFQPDIFSDIDFDKELATYYKDFFDYTLTDADIAMILNTEANANSK